MIDLFGAFGVTDGGLTALPLLFPPPPVPPLPRLVRGAGGGTRGFFCVGTKIGGRDWDVLRLLLRIPFVRKSNLRVGNRPWSS